MSLPVALERGRVVQDRPYQVKSTRHRGVVIYDRFPTLDEATAHYKKLLANCQPNLPEGFSSVSLSEDGRVIKSEDCVARSTN